MWYPMANPDGSELFNRLLWMRRQRSNPDGIEPFSLGLVTPATYPRFAAERSQPP